LKNVATAPVARDLNLMPIEDAIADETDAFIVERIPFSLLRYGAQQVETLMG
jgi:hypothetical protein